MPEKDDYVAEFDGESVHLSCDLTNREFPTIARDAMIETLVSIKY